MRARGGGGVSWLYVFLGGGLGSVTRLGLSLAANRLVGAAFPWGTLLINVLGSFVIGWYGFRAGPGPAARIFVMTGFCGGFTTFSSFSLQTVELMRLGHPVRAAAYIVASVVLCVFATTAGIALAKF